ncbi:GcrA family cell cycle regulator [Gluconacetobacter tumulisoli]|uniref:GcrA cell cycle regulator n=1 Tax=Gluconacetobacter tumulisoli TaxID=1286189 RepID=A0A7W4K4W2_9PROT|nr:GcrA family cell cycle regulator [Gluconacetobacter tumulisoli]MBB2200450.1 GcrA cell cycle regulator [Gluconacetobacter tumulisoli]
MAMEWTEETIARLRELWQQGLSTAEIGRQLAVTKNAVVGKAHRLGLQARPSPIRRPAASARPTVEAPSAPTGVAPAPVVAAPAVSTPVAPTEAVDRPPVTVQPPQPVAEIRPVAATLTEIARPAAPVPAAPPVTPAPVEASQAGTPAAAAPADQPAVPAARPEVRVPLRAVAAPAPRRSGLTCCWPLGDPGTPGFHFCGATPVPGKPYCVEHAQLAYVKLRDRRDNVA